MRKPLLALALAIIPFFVFVGSQSTVQVNGVTTSDTRFNILGIALGALALGMGASVLRRGATGRAVKAVAALAGLVAIAQLAVASGQVRIDPRDWADWSIKSVATAISPSPSNGSTAGWQAHGDAS
ncbi:hypothetical protein [Achromobacter deleyi]|uniref:hypothetical protein n=1 Tax=Achromobacter deleyi TaxID=1353891 RepID=UPI0014918559|nr:hypothetical protein [Achromobacter deleyi]QVQ27694.1 hypothetical protein HLG70_04400 [Achromobacter deleyi]UIP23293.1 hypothetical protein LYZ39_12510 [Achromobacter deleyi]